MKNETLYGVTCAITDGRSIGRALDSWCTTVEPTTFDQADAIAIALNDNLFKSPMVRYAVAEADENHPLWDFTGGVNEDGGENR